MAIKWLWRYIDGAKTAGELYGRALTVIAAEQYACRLVVPQSQRGHTNHWSSHKDRATKALAKLAKPHLPSSLTRLHTAIEQAHREAWTAEPDPSTDEVAADADVEQDEAAADGLEDEDLTD